MDKSREFKQIIDKIETVYNKGILQDDFAFKFRNNDEIESENLVQ